jgi:uncharacterized protein YbjT (DUF2867 family)
MRRNTIGLIGGSGFIGSHVVNALVAEGRQVRVATRRREHAKHLTLLPIDVLELDVRDPAQLEVFVADTDAIVNLVGTLHSRRGDPYGLEFAELHVELPQKIVAACHAQSVRRLLHVSALGAHPEGPSMYLRSKGDGELVVRKSGLATTIFRPSVVFGPGDAFLNKFAALQRVFPVIPLACAKARFQPVYVGDVAKAIVNAIDLDHALNRTYELGGPRIYTLEELVRFAGLAIGKPRKIIALPDALGRLQARVFELAPGVPMLTRDNLDSMKVDNVTSGPTAPELQVTPSSLEAIAPGYLTGD